MPKIFKNMYWIAPWSQIRKGQKRHAIKWMNYQLSEKLFDGILAYYCKYAYSITQEKYSEFFETFERVSIWQISTWFFYKITLVFKAHARTAAVLKFNPEECCHAHHYGFGRTISVDSDTHNLCYVFLLTTMPISDVNALRGYKSSRTPEKYGRMGAKLYAL